LSSRFFRLQNYYPTRIYGWPRTREETDDPYSSIFIFRQKEVLLLLPLSDCIVFYTSVAIIWYIASKMGGGTSAGSRIVGQPGDFSPIVSKVVPSPDSLPMSSCQSMAAVSIWRQDADTAFQQLKESASLLESEGKLSEAKSLYIAAVTRFRSELGDSHPSTVEAINSLGLILQQQERLGEIEPLLRDIVSCCQAQCGRGHKDTIRAIINLSGFLKTQGRLIESETLLKGALTSLRALRGDTHRDTLLCASTLAGVLKMQGRITDAEPLYREVCVGFMQQEDPSDPSAISAIYNLAVVLEAQGKFSEAEALYKMALDRLRPELGGKFDQKTLEKIIRNNPNSYSNSESLYREALIENRAKLGNRHSATLASINNLAVLLKEAGRYSEAEILYR
jgi:tetratricopeptide (TPR) repeat protein